MRDRNSCWEQKILSDTISPAGDTLVGNLGRNKNPLRPDDFTEDSLIRTYPAGDFLNRQQTLAEKLDNFGRDQLH